MLVRENQEITAIDLKSNDRALNSERVNFHVHSRSHGVRKRSQLATNSHINRVRFNELNLTLHVNSTNSSFNVYGLSIIQENRTEFTGPCDTAASVFISNTI